jgi:uncharacterized DUF497 family protein
MLSISPGVREKLATKHGVTPTEIEQCFANRDGGFLEDLREEHRTDPPTQWFISETNAGRVLKVVFIRRTDKDGVRLHLRTAYPPNDEEIRIYERHAK